MASGRSNFGNHNRPAASVRAHQKKADKTMKSALSTATAVTAAVSHEMAKQSKKATRRRSSEAVSPEYAAAVRMAQDRAEAEARARAEAPKVRRPVTPGRVRTISAICILVGLVATLLFWPVGLGIVAVSVYCIVCAGKIADQQNERAGLSAAGPQGGGEL